MKGEASFERMDFGFERFGVKSEAEDFLDPSIIGLLGAHSFGRFMRGVLYVRPGYSATAMVILIKSGRVSKEPLGSRREWSRRVDDREAGDRRVSRIETVEGAWLTGFAVVLPHKQRHCR